MSAGAGHQAVVAALFANTGIAISKFVAFAVTRSPSMLAESVHSVADAGNQLLLLLGASRARREATDTHPFGHGPVRYFWAFVVAVVLFTLGSLFALYEGVEKLRHPHDLDSAGVAIGVLLVGIVLECFSLRTAYREAQPLRGRRSWWRFIREEKSPEIVVVLLEDVAALVGLVFALTGVSLALVTGNERFDAVGTLAIGLLLGVVAVVLAIEMHSLLLGEAATPDQVEAIRQALVADPELSRVIHLKTLHLGPDDLLVVAKVAAVPGASLETLAAAIDRAEARVRAAVPLARVIYLEPDVYRAPPPAT